VVTEKKMNEGSPTKTTNSTRMVGRVTNIPICMIACEPSAVVLRDSLQEGQVANYLLIHCPHRRFEKLPGYVDVDVLSTDNLNSVSETPMKAAIACCSLQQAS
jgi:hypothetical protein